jgi:hypothetical protein
MQCSQILMHVCKLYNVYVHVYRKEIYKKSPTPKEKFDTIIERKYSLNCVKTHERIC